MEVEAIHTEILIFLGAQDLKPSVVLVAVTFFAYVVIPYSDAYQSETWRITIRITQSYASHKKQMKLKNNERSYKYLSNFIFKFNL